MKTSTQIATQFATILGSLLISTVGLAKTDVKGALSTLKANETNSKENLKQYQANRDIAKKNAEEVTNAIKDLRQQRNALTANGKNLEKNRAILEQMKVKIAGFKAQEQKLIDQETAQRAQLEALIKKLDENKTLREQNLAAYDSKISEIESEKANWDQQRNEMASIHEEINVKEKTALAEREKWLGKYKGYSEETKKWGAQAATAEETRIKFDQLQK